MRITEDQMWGYFEWLFFQYGLLQGLAVAAVLAVGGFIACYLAAVTKYGPTEGFYHVTRIIYELIARDIPSTSFTRIMAFARLAFKEAIRRKVLVLMAVFVLILLFAGWFLDRKATNVATLYISFVMTGTSYLVLLLGLFLSCFSLPNDIKTKTIQTITTKPVRPTEIILGRIFGFVAVGTLLLVVMGFLSYTFVVRGVVHAHDVDVMVDEDGEGVTEFDAFHKHEFTMVREEDGSFVTGVTDEQKGHKHTVRAVTDASGKVTGHRVGEPEGLLAARVPLFGELSIYDRNGNLTKKGINVGNESEYKSYIEGNSLMKATWSFDGLRPNQFPTGKLPLEMSLGAFRTYKGDIVTGVQGEIIISSADGVVQSDRIPFIVKEFSVDHQEIDFKLPGSIDKEPQEIDIFEDIASRGPVQISIRCTDPGQYFGVAHADLFLRRGEATFGWNLFKGFLGIWMQMVLVICLGVMFSTFLSGPVAIVATLTSLIIGFFGGMAVDIAINDAPGGGPIESAIRMVMQTGAMIQLDLGNPALENTIKFADRGIIYLIVTEFQAIPSFGQFNTSEFVAYGFNIFEGLVARHLTMTVCYFFLTSIIAYFFLKTRELAAA